LELYLPGSSSGWRSRFLLKTIKIHARWFQFIISIQHSKIPTYKIHRQAVMNYRILFILFIGFSFLAIPPLSAQTQSDPNGPTEAPAAGIKLVKAVMSEDLQERTPQNITTVFTIERRKAICFTAFDPVPEKTVIYHHWFHRDRPSAKLKLTLKPPRWSSYSTIQFRAEDIGPWRVEIADSNGQVFHILRFSVTE